MAAKPVVVQWILDTRTPWPEARKTKDLETHASRALSLLPASDRAAVLRYFHVSDAKMSLGSHLLKRYAIAKLAGVPWAQVAITRDARTKPVYVDPVTGRQPVAFNVSHQAGLVAMIAVAEYAATSEDGSSSQSAEAVEVGVDVVCVSERTDRDKRMIRDEGWGKFVDMHADVFSRAETSYLKYQVLVPPVAASGPATATTTSRTVAARGLPPPSGASATLASQMDYKLRAFYALWNLREAWVKMTGEALLAEWLGELEFRNFWPPAPTPAFAIPAQESTGEEPAQVITEHEVYFKGKRVDDSKVVQTAMGPDYMICTAARTPQKKSDALSWRLASYEFLNLEDVLGFAEGSKLPI